MPIACIVSDFPIIAASAERMLAGTFTVYRYTWNEYSPEHWLVANLVLLDVTQITGDRVLDIVSQLPQEARILITSLDRNEVDVYEISHKGLARQGELPSLLSLGA